LQWLGLHYTSATSGILYLSTTPIFILLMAIPLGEGIGPRQWLGVAISFCGVYLIATQGRPALLAFNRGDLLALASMVMWAGYTILLRMRRDPLDTVELLTVVCGFGLAFMTPWLAVELLIAPQIDLTRAGLLAVLYSAIGALLLAYAGWSYVVRRLGAARAGATLHLMPAIGVLLAALFLGESARWFHVAGIALILAGVGLSSVKASAASSIR
jgi:drug/metabolite transporter (DMT)-like permease